MSSSSSSSYSSPAPSRPASPFLKLSISTTSLASLLPSFHTSATTTTRTEHKRQLSPVSLSDLLARESDVIVSTNITSQLEYKGFAWYVISGIFLSIWMIWSLCPAEILTETFGIYYYPSRWWVLLVPSFILVSMGYTYVALALYNIEIETLKLNDLRTIVDDSGVVVTQLKNYKETNKEQFVYNSTSGIWDLTISDVNKVLYSE